MALADLCVVNLEVSTAEDAIRHLARKLAERGFVLPSFETAALKREKRSPTGLPFPGAGIALPHAEPEHVAQAGIAIATLLRPVYFRQMGSPTIKLEVSLVVMPVLTAKEQALAGLSRLIELLQDDGVRAGLLGAKTSSELAELLGLPLGA